LPGPQDDRDGQVEEQEEEREQPGRRAQRALVAALGEGHVVLARQEERGRRRDEQQRRPRALAHRRVQLVERLRMGAQPAGQAARPVEHAEQREGADREQRDQLDHRLERDRHDQAVVLLARGHVARAEEDREGGHQQAEDEAEERRAAGPGQDVDRGGDRADLLGQVRQAAGQEERRDRDTRVGAAIAEGEQVGQRRQLVVAGQAQDRQPQDRHQQAGQRHAEVDGEEAVALEAGEPDAAVVAPGAGVDAERERAHPRVARDAGRDPLALGRLGEQEQHAEIEEGDREEDAGVKLHRRLWTG
jgi:hypothetical protein